ncbi:MAG: hypothetical protein J6Y74_01325 [Clostridia bacterium]|nr:hypothetical protein [Clostridia bacterium]
MKKAVVILLVLLFLFAAACGGQDGYVLTEDNFFLVMTNMIYYPQQYADKEITFDAFTYALTDVEGREYMCAVRKCSSGYGCNCGKDTVIGFILDYDGEIPAPRNQSADGADKTWIHTTGKLVFTDDFAPTEIRIYAADGSTVETVSFYTFRAAELTLIENYSDLQWYVTK